jgi:hypothetical protein
MGVAFLKEIAKSDVIVDPFCGVGTIIAMANAVGVDSIGIEISDRRCRKARRLSLTKVLHEMKPSLRRQLGLLHYTYIDDGNTNDIPDAIDNVDNVIDNENIYNDDDNKDNKYDDNKDNKYDDNKVNNNDDESYT